MPPVRLLVLLIAVLLLPQALARAQNIDPKVLNQLQLQLGAMQAARDAAQAAQQAAQGQSLGSIDLEPTGQRVDTPEEQEVRRAQARRQLESLYEPSPVERDYRTRLADPQLRQFGYEFFQAAPPPTGVRTGAIGNDYILGIGDELQVSFRGSLNQSNQVRVDRDGMIVVGNLPPIRAAGRSLGAVRAEIAAATRSTMLATEVFVSMGEVRSISVFVGGEVARPGLFSLTSLSDIGTAIAQAGGVRRSGSLRQVRVIRAGGGTVTVDLYGLLGIGTPPSIRLQDGDRVIVPVIGPTVAITGDVPRPGIYELRGAASLQAVVGFAGGPVRQRGAEVTISRIGPGGAETFIRTPSATANVLPGDAILVLGGSAGGAESRVFLEGHVANPGPRPLGAAPTVAALLRSPANLRPDTYRLMAVLVRRDMMTGARSYVALDLGREFSPVTATVLRPEDRVILLSQDDIEYLATQREEAIRADAAAPANSQRDEQPQLEAQDELRRQGVTALLRQNPELAAFLRERLVYVSGSVRRSGGFPVAGPVAVSVLADAAEGIADDAVDIVVDIQRGSGGPSERIATGRDLALAGGLLVSPGDSVRFSGTRSDLEAGVVNIVGEVLRPGNYRIRRGETLSQLIDRAGGLTAQAYAFGTVFTRVSVRRSQEEGFRRTARELYNGLIAVTARSGARGPESLSGAVELISAIAGAEAPGRVVIEADPRVLAIRPDLDTILEPGDSITIPKQPNFVLALGDLNNPGALQHVPGKTATAYVREAGGTSSTADSRRVFVVFPNGSSQPISMGGWGGGSGPALPPGSTIVVPKNLDPLLRLTVFRDVTTIIAQLATSVATVGLLATR